MRMLIVFISYAAALLAFSSMALLLYIAFCQVFLGHDGHLDRLFGRGKACPSGRMLPYLLPAAVGIALFALYCIASSFYRNSLLQISKNGFYTLLPVGPSLFDPGTLLLCFFSLLFYIDGSALAWRQGGERWCLLYCLNPAAVFFVLPNPCSLLCFLLSAGYWGIGRKKYWLAAVCGAVFIGVHFPFHGIDWGEGLALGYTLLLPWLSRVSEKKFSFLTGVLAMICGMLPILSLCILMAT